MKEEILSTITEDELSTLYRTDYGKYQRYRRYCKKIEDLESSGLLSLQFLMSCHESSHTSCHESSNYCKNCLRKQSVEEEGVIKVDNFSSVRFSSLYQKSVFSNQIRQNALELTDAFFDLEDAVEQVIRLINSNGGFTVIGWYKRGKITDRTLLHQKKKNDSQKQSNETSDVQIDNRTINYHPCVIKPTNTSFFDKKSKLCNDLATLKFDSSVLLHSS